MRSLLLATILLGMTITALAAKEADTSDAMKRSSVDAARQLVINSDAAPRSKAQEIRRQPRKPADFSAERLIPDICTGC
ncbi:hypothetical protein JJB99_20360 [Bradyrhizobium diazoefficiens]|uniref:hypothetical protein n=1 Tax=Bradyrhizobium diazoefficiens TaxID=1355477 RepID=UPI00190B1522|nr:hypothetical protein [Bradyrhizobium diazoefficiens]QQO11860.1 hypothetical protein JJB99_20360 [Bradyrhizobium diazoefficiens]